MMNTAIWWIRRDLRLSDSQALTAALNQTASIVPLFVLDSRLLASAYVGPKRTAFLYGGLRALDRDLRRRGSRLIVRQGDPVEALTTIFAESRASAIFAEEDISPYARQRDARVAAKLPLHLVGGPGVHPPDLLLKKDGQPYTVFTPFSKAWKALARPGLADLLPVPDLLVTPADLQTLPIPDEPAQADDGPFEPGATEALRRLEQFTELGSAAIYRYAQRRNLTDVAGTSGLSPYLRFGMLSMRQAVAAADQAWAVAPDREGRKGAETWLNELIWREFYLSILYHFPYVLQRNFRSQYDGIDWENDPVAFAAWCRGRTGYPFVDAAMRQLVQSGWMHNRARMIVASFLTKDLLIDWRWGERFFMEHLLDGDPAANNGGWQWAAGTGTDAAPYFRIFNPVLQSKKFDQDGRYIRKWLPELAEVPDRHIHEPWLMPAEIQRQTGCRIGRDYPAPIVDHATARARTLEAYKRSGN